MLFYIDSDMTGIPAIDYSSGRNVLDVMQDTIIALSNSENEILYSAINENIVTINEGLSFNIDFSIYEITDGEKSVFSKIKALDSNNFLILEDISALKHENIKIKLPRLNITIDNDGTTKSYNFSRGMSIVFEDSLIDAFYIKNGGARRAFSRISSSFAKSSNGAGFYCFYNENKFLFACQNNYSGDNFTTIACIANENGFVEYGGGPLSSAANLEDMTAFNVINASSLKTRNVFIGEYFGVVNMMTDHGYIFRSFLDLAGDVPKKDSKKPKLFGEDIIVFNLGNVWAGLLYE